MTETIDPAAAERTVPTPEFLEVRDLHVQYSSASGPVYAVDGVSFSVARGEVFAIVGESGCGKSSTARAILRLEPITSGTVQLDGIETSAIEGKQLRAMRRRFQMVFQDPFTSLDPRLTVGRIIREAMVLNGVGDRSSRRKRSDEMLRLVGLDESFDQRMPRNLSGGQRQRIGIARALVLDPDVLVCDEPVSALDVSIQAQIIRLLDDLQNRLGLTIVFISHDLAVVRHVADRVAVMYLGKIVETATVDALFGSPAHPYSQALISAAPLPNTALERSRHRILLTGDVPSAANPPSGCRFRTRCKYAQQRCSDEEPLLRRVGDGHEAACHFFEEIRANQAADGAEVSLEPAALDSVAADTP
jgi:oligopeptide/dipeptide ABC transporter ATP-binding protein